MNINELMLGIRDMDLVLPEFQREYVWTREQAKQLVVSLLHDYPTGSLLVWKTTKPPEIKNNAVPADRIGTTSVILDGQQRLTTLYLLIQDAIPPYYTSADIMNDPRTLYYDLESKEIQYYSSILMKHDPAWAPITNCFDDSRIDVFSIAQQKASQSGDLASLAQRYFTNLNQLRSIRTRDFPIQTVPSSAGVDDAIDVFDRVNSLGTKLTDAELALAHITGKWPHARRVMKDEIENLSASGFRFDLTFLVRALTGVVRRRALFETVHDATAAELKEGWQRLSKLLRYLTGILSKWGHIHSSDDLSTTNVLIPPIVFLACHGGTFTSDRELRLFIRWLYAASTWARYTGQTDQRLEHDVSVVRQIESPWKKLVDAIIDQRGRIELKAADLEGRGIMHPLYRMTYILAKINGSTDWYNGASLDASGSLHSHHIFPQALLYGDGGLDPENHIDKQKVNEIANRAFLTAEVNMSLSDAPPEKTLSEVEKNFPRALQKQFVPTDPALWSRSRYEEFLQQRREAIARAYNDQMQSLLAEIPEPEPTSLLAVIESGESANVEFKSSLRWDTRKEQVNRELEIVVAKTVAAFLNSAEGTLLVGVSDDGTVLGIEDDIKSLGRKDEDGFTQALVNVLVNHLGAEFSPYYRLSIEGVNGKRVCKVDMEPAPKPAFLNEPRGAEFYIRVGTTTRRLDAQEQFEYIAGRWGS